MNSRETYSLISHGGVRLHLHAWHSTDVADKVVVIVHGMGGHGDYYNASFAPFFSHTQIYAPDLQGHGLSEGIRGDIETFEHFQADIAATMRWVRQRHPNLPIFLLGESMGTSIALTYAAHAQADERPDYLVLVACVIAPSVMPRPAEVARTLYFLVRDRKRSVIPITGREEQGVRDPEFIKVLKSDILFNRKVSVRFLTSMTLHMRRAARLHHKLTLPVFMAVGGRDITISHRSTKAFFKRIAAVDKELHYFPDAFHALLNDPDAPLVREKLQIWMNRQLQSYTSKRSLI